MCFMYMVNTSFVVPNTFDYCRQRGLLHGVDFFATLPFANWDF